MKQEGEAAGSALHNDLSDQQKEGNLIQIKMRATFPYDVFDGVDPA